MSEYSYEERPRHRHRTRDRDRDPGYVAETTYIERGSKGSGVRDLVYRPREDSIEDIPRVFPPPGAEYRQTRYRETYDPPRRARSVNHRDYDDTSEYSYGGYDRGRRHGDYERDSHYSDEYDRPRPRRRKSVVDNIKEIGEGLGLGGVIGAVAGRSPSRSRHRRHRDYDSDGHDRYTDRHDRRQRRYSSSSRSRSGGRRHRTDKKWEQAAKAAVVAGAVEAFRSRKEPGPWAGDKGQRVATAALGAAGIDSLVDKDPGHKGKRHVAEAAIGGLLATRLANGSRSRSRGRDRSQSRSRPRSRSLSIFGRNRSKSRGRERSTIRDVASTGAVLAAGKALYNRVRSKSRPRHDRSRSLSASSGDDFAPSRSRRTKYNRRKGVDEYDGAGGGRRSLERGGVVATAARGGNHSDSESSTDMENKRKKMRGKELLTAGLATVATIHAAHGVYNSMVASENRRKMVSEGEISAEEARKRKSKNMLQDAAAVGIAALGIKSAFSEWKEMNEQHHGVKELEDKRRKRRKARERREREARQNAFAPGVNGYANPSPPYSAAPYPTTYADGNPYGAVPPPPIGPPGPRY